VSELLDVLRAIEEGRDRGEPMALATVVGVKGSTYRREGARLLVPAEGRPVGTISGGCLEGEVREIAAEVMRQDRPRLLRFDLTADDEAVWGWGLGCNGVVDVFVEPAARAAEMAGAIRRAIDEQRELVAATVLGPDGDDLPAGIEPGARMLVHPDATTEGSLGPPGLDREAVGLALAALDAERSGTVAASGVRIFLEVLAPPIRLLICGAGHDARPLVRFAAELGWRVEVLDDREAFLKPGRFPGAARFVRTEPADAAAAAGVDGRTHVVVMSHNFLRDRDYLRSFLGSPAPYIGMLGPSARLARLLDALRQEGLEPDPRHLEAVHGPAGLDLGAEGPEEVAWAITGEILALRNGRTGGFLRDREGPIHGRDRAEPQGRDRAEPQGRDRAGPIQGRDRAGPIQGRARTPAAS
jgi:xanthine dehydrogenase accessory factor